MDDKNKSQKDAYLQTPKGMRDILPEEYRFYQDFFKTAEEVANYYGFRPIQTPHLEKINLFTATLGETTDIIEKQMYTLKTRGGDQLVLRPEGTAPAMRAYLRHGMQTRPQPVMLWYQGSFFRHENPQSGRLREFQSFGMETLGEANSVADATIIRVATAILEELGIKNYIVRINSIGDKECRNAYRKELTNYYRRRINRVCKDCKRRLKENPLRLLDCKEKECQEAKKDAPQMINFLCQDCKTHFKEVLETLDTLNIPYALDHYLVRGLDYYSRTVFEITIDSPRGKTSEKEIIEIPTPVENEAEITASDAENQSVEKEKKETPKIDEEISPLKNFALAGGGRYDYLSKIISNKNVPGVGIGIGAERVVMALSGKKLLKVREKNPKIFFIQIGSLAKRKSLLLTEIFRKANIPIAQSVTKESLKSQIKIAERLGASTIMMLGQKEALDDTIIIRDAGFGAQNIVPFSKAVEFIKRKLKKR